MRWTSIERPATLGIDWSARRSRPIDPYLIWADLSGFRGATIDADAPVAAPTALRLALELDAGASDIGIEYKEVACWDGSRYATALVRPEQLARLLDQPAVRRVELGFVGNLFSLARSSSQPIERIARPVVAVIDFGCAFAHERFRHWRDGSWRTRIAYLWDQSRTASVDRSAPDPWHAVAGQGYGRELTATDIDSLVAKHTTDKHVDEDAVYRAADYNRSVATVLTHGTHVLDLAAGAPGDAHEEDAPTIIFVQLPDYAVNDTSGGSMVTHVMDALRYILDRTHEHAPLVANLSYGSMAGPHDGSTILESVMDAVIAAAMGPLPATAAPSRYLSIVLPAGNNFEADGHAFVRLNADTPSQPLQWQVLADDPTDTFLEIWYPKRFAGRVDVTVEPPDGPACTIPIDATSTLTAEGSPEPICAVIHRTHVASGRNDAMALIALAPTQARGSERPEAAAGTWRVTISLAPTAPTEEEIEVHAWIERDDPPIGSGAPPRQSRFLTEDVPLAVNEDSPVNTLVRRDVTCSSIANGTRTVIVGACLVNPETFELSRYSSAGPSRNTAREKWPDVVANADEARSLSGVLAAGTRSGVRLRMNGTSVAAPQVARRLIGQFLPFVSRPPDTRDDPGSACPNGSLIGKIEPAPCAVNVHRAGRGRLLP